MLLPSIQKPKSVLKVLSITKAVGNVTSNSSIMEQEDSPTSRINANKYENTSRRSKFNSHFGKQHSDTNFHSLKSSGSGRSCGSGLLTKSRPSIQTSNIVNRALEVMSNSLKDADYTPRKPVKSVDDDDTEDDSEKDPTPSDSSNSDNDVESPNEPTSRLGNITAQLSFRKIAKKRRKAGGRTSFHHTKSSKEYLRKAQEAYQRLKINEQQKQNDQHHQKQLESGRDGIENNKNLCKDRDPDTSRTSIKAKESEVIDYGYGDPADSQTKDAVDYGYGDSVGGQPQQTVDYGYGDSAGGQPHLSRRGGRPRRRNSVTKFSVDAANVVAAQAAAQRILKLKPSLTSLSRTDSTTTPTRSRQQQDQPQRSNTKQIRDLRARRTGRITGMETTLQRQHQHHQGNHEDQKNLTDKIDVDRLGPPQRPSRHPRSVYGDRGSVMQSLRLQEAAESKHSKHESSASQHLQMTSEYFSSEPKPKDLLRRNSGRLNGATFRFNTPARTSSWLSHDTSYSTVNNDDDDADSLASDMESLCSMRDGNYRLDIHHSNNHTLKNRDIPPVLPTPPSPLVFASPPLPDRRTRFSGGRSISGEINLRNSLGVSWSSGSNKEGSLSRFARRQSGSNDFPILPYVRVVTTNGSSSKFMPAPVRRTPSYKGSQQRQD